MKRRAGFTVAELIITITIMVILMTLGVVNLRSSQANARDEERKTDMTNLALYYEGRYSRDNGTYLHWQTVSSTAMLESFYYTNVDRNNLRAPGVEPPAYSIVPATNSTQTITGVQPLPTETTYVYQPMTDADVLCGTAGACRKFNLYYYQETTNTVKVIKSKNQ